MTKASCRMKPIAGSDCTKETSWHKDHTLSSRPGYLWGAWRGWESGDSHFIRNTLLIVSFCNKNEHAGQCPFAETQTNKQWAPKKPRAGSLWGRGAVEPGEGRWSRRDAASPWACTTRRPGGWVCLSPRQPSHHHNGTAMGLPGDLLKRLLSSPLPTSVGLGGRYPPTPFCLSLSGLENKEHLGHSLKQKHTFDEVQ